MRVVTPAGETIIIGTVETAPTIGIRDFSRIVTDDFGVTTIVERRFRRFMNVRVGLPFEAVDALQRRLAELRATSAQWIADDRFAWLKATGFYKDFTLDLAVPPLSYCNLSVEGLAEASSVTDAGEDPATASKVSSLQMLRPAIVTDGVLIASDVPENDAPAWSAGTTYPMGGQVIRGHRIYESLIVGNVGIDPTTDAAKWLDTGPTNRWAMFDQALGTSTTAASITVTLAAGTVNAVALLDVSGSTVRVQADAFDQTIDVADGAIVFDLPASDAQVTVTIAGPSASVGTLLIGRRIGLGVTESSPTAGITDFSRKVEDDFGDVTVVERAWAKKMAVKTLIRTDAVDVVADRLASVRAQPVLWIAQPGVDSLTVCGLCREWSIEIGATASKVSLTIAGLGKAAPIVPIGGGGSVAWPDIIDSDPNRPKPADGATVGMTDAEAKAALVGLADAELRRIRDRELSFPSPDGASVYTLHRREETARTEGFVAVAETFDLLGAVGRFGTAFIFGDNAVFAQDDKVGGTTYVSVSGALAQNEARIEDVRQVLVGPTGAFARALMTVDVNGRAIGYSATNDGTTGSFTFVSDRFSIETPAGIKLFYADGADGGRVKMPNVEVDTLKIDTVRVQEVAQGAVQKSAWASLGSDFTVPHDQTLAVFTLPFVKEDNDSAIKVFTFLNLRSSDDLQCDVSVQVDGMAMQQAQRINLVLDNANSQAQAPLSPQVFITGILAGPHTITIKVYNHETDNIPLTVVAGSSLEVTELRKAAIGSITGGGGALPQPGSGGSGTGADGGYNGRNYLAEVSND